MHPYRLLTTLALTTLLACDHDDHDAVPHDADVSAPIAGAPGRPAESPTAAKHLGDVQTMPNAQAVFAETIKLIEDKYVDAAVDRDALYTGATEGLLARLYQVGDHPVNTLMSPRELEELRAGTAGAIVGVGVEIGQSAGVVVVLNTIPGGPAAKAGLQPGDRILGIGEARVNNLSLGQVVDKIRGADGTQVDLFLQRDTEEWHATVTRAKVEMQNVGVPLLDGDVGYLALRGFAETTPAELDAAIAGLQAKGMRSLILDLRDCPGGLFDAAITIAGRFLREGQAIAGVAHRGGDTKHHVTAADGPHADSAALPLVVLVGPHTSSGAEVVADALQTHGRATLVGQPTLGKDSVEHVHALSNGWGLKLTGGRLIGAAGEPRNGKGVTPRLPVPADDDEHKPPTSLDGDADAAISVARAWLRERR